MRSHFIPRGVAAACAVAGATTVLNGNCSAGTFVAADFATNSIYGSGWSAGQNGGYGFGAWSFNGTVSPVTNIDYPSGIPDPGQQQEMSSGSPIGTAWTLFNQPAGTNSGNGLSDVGRAITEPGGLQPGQTFETVIENPTVYNYYGGFDILFFNGTDNDLAGVNASALRTDVFNYFVTTWKVVDNSGPTPTSLAAADTGAAGVKIDFTLLTTNTYLFAMTPLSNPSNVYSHTGQLAYTSQVNVYSNNVVVGQVTVTNLPINWVNYRLWNTNDVTSGPVANNFEISYMTIKGLTLNIQIVGTNAVLSWPTNVPGFNLAFSLNLGAGTVWNTNLPSPVVVNGQNVVTNPITNVRQFYRLQQ